MSRPNYPTQLRDHVGNVIRLPAKPFATGGEGAVFDVVGRPDLVAKLYSKPQSKERCDKLHAMAKLCNPDLLKIAAWPTATLNNGNSVAVEGILMPRVADHKEIHHLYSVAQRKRDFPEVDWAFLLHTARNCAIAFETIHGHGHIVGDVNQKNVMVSRKGTVALVDCDSFQVKEGNRIFRCGVGVPEYTPPELHGKRFADLDRITNHDLFGLAVMVFHLLMMGRHPFAGVPQVNVDIPIETAIKDGFFAYSRTPNKLMPPPHVPPMMMLDIATRDMFERAFCSRQRPTATEWRNVLDASMKGLQRCKNDRKHTYSTGDTCPWCQLIAVARLQYFIPSQTGLNTALPIEHIRNLAQKLRSMQLVFTAYVRPTPILPIQVRLPASLRAIQKPKLIPHPAPPSPVKKPSPVPLPLPPIFLARPTLRPMPASPFIPFAPKLKPYPPKPLDLPSPKLHAKPQRPEYPPPPALGQPDRFIDWLCVAGVVAGGPVYLVAWPVGMMMIVCFGAWLLFMKLTEGMRREMALNSLIKAHELECAEMDEEYEERIQPLQKANDRLLYAWKRAIAAQAVRHAQACRAIDDENSRTIAPWEAEKAVIEAKHQEAIRKVEQINRNTLLAWETENAARQAAYDQTRRKAESENQQHLSAWGTLTAARERDYHQECMEIDARNQQELASWEVANAPWIYEQKVWRDCASAAETEIRDMEREFIVQRQAQISNFQRLKTKAEGLLQSNNGVLQDYERELHQSEIDSKKIQLDGYLDTALIRHAKLKGITGDRILALESFGIETAKDVSMLGNQKVPGIGPVLSRRLFDWRDKLAWSFRPQQGLPEAEKNRIATRYTPVLLPFVQAVEAAIKELESVAADHYAREAKRLEAISVVVQKMSVAEAHVRMMEVM